MLFKYYFNIDSLFAPIITINYHFTINTIVNFHLKPQFTLPQISDTYVQYEVTSYDAFLLIKMIYLFYEKKYNTLENNFVKPIKDHF